MTNYYIENDDKIILVDDDLQRLQNTVISGEYSNFEIKETDRPIINFEFADTPEYIAEQEAKEKERIGNLEITKRVFALALKQFGISYQQLKDLIATNEDAQLEWDLCERLQRKNPLIDIMAGQLGVTPELLDRIFVEANNVVG